MEFGKKLRELRRQRHLSQEKLSEQIHVSRQAISKWEQGSTRPDTDNIIVLSQFFQVPVEYFLTDDDMSRQDPYSNQLYNKGEKIFSRSRIICFIVGILAEISAIIGAYFLQYQEKQVYDSFFAHPLDYLLVSPLKIVVVIGGGMILYAIYPLLVKVCHLVVTFYSLAGKNSKL